MLWRGKLCHIRTSDLPFYYRKLAGISPDSKTVKHLLEDLDILGFGKTKYVMDRGFYSKDNINSLYKEHVKFLVGVNSPSSSSRAILMMYMMTSVCLTTLMMALILMVLQSVLNGTTHRTGHILAILSNKKRRIYIHYFYSIGRGVDEEPAFDKRIATLCNELVENKEVEIKAARRYIGYFALITNEKMDAFTALHLNKVKVIVEKGFCNIKEKLNMRRLLFKSERTLTGKYVTNL